MRTMLLSVLIGFFLSAGICRGQASFPPTLPPISPEVPPSLPPPFPPASLAPPPLLPPPATAPRTYPHVHVLPPLTAPTPTPTIVPRKPTAPLDADTIPRTESTCCLPPSCQIEEEWDREDRGPWLDLAYLFWWTRPGARTPPVTTTGSLTGLDPGTLNSPDTRVVLGGRDFKFGAASGLRATVGGWFAGSDLGVEAGFFILERRADGRRITSDGSSPDPLPLFTPFTEVGLPLGQAAVPIPITGPGLLASASLNETRRLYGTDINVITSLGGSDTFSTILLTGFRFLSLEDSLAYNTETQLLSNPGISLRTLDQWKTQNRFFGWQIGGKFEYRSGQFFVNNVTKLALGSTCINTATEGSLLDTSGPTPKFSPGGIFTNAANLGHGRFQRVAVVPDVQVNIGLVLLPNLRTYLGYNFLYWSSILEPGNMIDTRLDLASQDPKVPVNLRNTSEFWAQGLSWGVEWQF